MKYSEIPQLTRPAHYSVHVQWNHLPARVDGADGELDLNPDFQRGHVWTEAQQIAYVEFKLRGGEGSDILYFNHPGWMSGAEGDYVIVDGKQRLHAVLRFLDNEITAFEVYRKDFEDECDVARRVNFIWKVNNLKTRGEVLRWYLEMNTGGTPHTDEEIERVRKMLDAEKKEKTGGKSVDYYSNHVTKLKYLGKIKQTKKGLNLVQPCVAIASNHKENE